MTTILAIEPGYEGATAVVIDDSATVRGRSEIEFPSLHVLPGGGLAQDAYTVLAVVVETGRAAAAQADTGIDVVALATPAEAVLAWEPDSGRPLSSLVVQADRDVAALCDALGVHRNRISERTGSALDPRHAAPKLAWLRRTLTGEGVATTLDSWLIHQLTGEFVTDAATAGQSLLADISTRDWDDEMLRLFGLTHERRPTIVPCDQFVGFTIAFGDPCAVGGVITSRSAALLGAGCLRPGEALCTFAGDEASLLVNTAGTPVRSHAGLTTSTAWRARGETTHCVAGRVSTAAVHLLRQLGHIADIADIDHVAAPDAGGVLAVPALNGLGTPWWRLEARESFTGMTSLTTAGHLVVAAMQGLAAQIAALGSSVAHDLGLPLRRLRVDGNLARCQTLMQAMADLMQVEIEVCPSDRAAVLGAAALARLAMDPTLSLSDAAGTDEPQRTHTPGWSSNQAADFLGRWSAVAENA